MTESRVHTTAAAPAARPEAAPVGDALLVGRAHDLHDLALRVRHVFELDLPHELHLFLHRCIYRVLS